VKCVCLITEAIQIRPLLVSKSAIEGPKQVSTDAAQSTHAPLIVMVGGGFIFYASDPCARQQKKAPEPFGSGVHSSPSAPHFGGAKGEAARSSSWRGNGSQFF
jgi:hypothetical protein